MAALDRFIQEARAAGRVAAFEASVAAIAAVAGVAPSDIRDARGPNHPLRGARANALYLMRTVCGCSLGDIAAVTGTARETVCKAVRRVEERRDEPLLDRLLDEAELELKGAVA